ncbi:MAG: nuclear transport factor 2 family protein [Ilumatobacteraceae bacterium]
MSVASLDQYLDAVREGDPAKLSATLANDIVMHGPLVSEPIAGRDQVAPVLGFAFGFVDEFRFGDVLTGPDVFATPFTGTVGDEELEGMEYLHVDGAGKDRLVHGLHPAASRPCRVSEQARSRSRPTRHGSRASAARAVGRRHGIGLSHGHTGRPAGQRQACSWGRGGRGHRRCGAKRTAPGRFARHSHHRD